MPDLSAFLSELQKAGHSQRCYATFFKGNLKLSASVNGTVTFPLTNIPIDTITSGAAANVKPGMRVMIYKSDGVSLKAQTRVRYSGTISSTNIPIREFSRGIGHIADNDIIKIFDDVHLSDKLVTATESFDPDGLSYSDQGSNPPPIPCSGGPYAGWTTQLPIRTTGQDSRNVDPDSGNVRNHTWTLPTGLSFASGVSTDANPQITGSAGEYEVPHTVEDDDNNKSIIQYMPVRIHDANDPPYDCVISSLRGEETDGWSATARVYGSNLTLTNIPDGCLCILWKEEVIGGAVQSFGNEITGRSHILLAGYVRRESSGVDSDGVERLEFEIISPLARIAELVGYSKAMEENATPDAWNEMKTLDTRRAKVQLLQFYTNLMEAGWDVQFHETFYNNYLYPAFYLQRSTPYQQIVELADGVDARLVCLRNGRFQVHTHPKLVQQQDRAAMVKTLTLTKADVLDWKLEQQHWRPVSVVEVRGFTAGSSDNQPVFMWYPGDSPGEGSESAIVDRMIFADLTEAMSRAGRRGADKDDVYVASDDTQHRVAVLDLILRGSYDVFDFNCEYIILNWSTLRRALNLADHYFYLMSVSVDYQNGTARTKLRLRTAPNADAAQSHPPPSPSETTLPTYDPPEFDFPTGIVAPTLEPTTHGLVYGATKICVLTAGRHFRYTANYDHPSPTWLAHDASATLPTAVAMCPDALTLDGPSGGWALANNGIYRYDGIGGSFSISLLHTYSFGSNSNLANIDADYLQEPGKFIVAATQSSLGTGAVRIIRSKDFGSTWQEVFTFGAISPFTGVPGVQIDPNQPGTAYVFGCGAADGGNNYCYMTTDHGDNWTKVASLNAVSVIGPGAMMPFGGPTNRLFFGHRIAFTTSHTLHRGTIGVGSVDIGPTYLGQKYGPRQSGGGRDVITSPAGNPRKLLMVTANELGVGRGVAITQDSEATPVVWTWIMLPSANNNVGYNAGILLDPYGDAAILYGLLNDYEIAYWDGTAIIDKSGNFPSFGGVVGVVGWV